VSTDGDVQVLVFGAGVGGLSLAGFLDRAGLDPVVVEPSETLDAPRGPVACWPDTVALLTRLGLADDLGDLGRPVRTWTRRRPDGTVAARLDAAGEFGFVAVEYGRLRARLLDGLPDGTVHTGSTLRALDSGPGGVAVEFGNGVREQFDVVVGADGVRSRTRALLGGEAPAFCGTTSVALPLAPDAGLEGASEVWTDDGAVFRAVPVDDGAMGWLTLPTTAPGQRWSDTDAIEAAVPAIDWHLSEALAAADLGTLWWGDDFHHTTARWAEDRVALLGDAAHARHRLTAVGAALAVEDAAVLAAELAGRTDPPAARLAAYATRRRERFAGLGERGGDHEASLLAGVESPLTDRCPTIPAVRGSRFAACFGPAPPSTPVAPALDDVLGRDSSAGEGGGGV
jgi:2-polyprenyl-6-methoxyphenol hydroxylase-like FAD-dependent oxidoreductase